MDRGVRFLATSLSGIITIDLGRFRPFPTIVGNEPPRPSVGSRAVSRRNLHARTIRSPRWRIEHEDGSSPSSPRRAPSTRNRWPGGRWSDRRRARRGSGRVGERRLTFATLPAVDRDSLVTQPIPFLPLFRRLATQTSTKAIYSKLFYYILDQQVYIAARIEVYCSPMHLHALNQAITLYRGETLSLDQAARHAGVTTARMRTALRSRNVLVREGLDSPAPTGTDVFASAEAPTATPATESPTPRASTDPLGNPSAGAD